MGFPEKRIHNFVHKTYLTEIKFCLIRYCFSNYEYSIENSLQAKRHLIRFSIARYGGIEMQMKIGNYIENALRQKGMSKTALYNGIRETFGTEDLDIAYNSFTSKIASNSLTAHELISIAAIMDLNLNDLVEAKKIYETKKMSFNSDEIYLQEELKEIILKESYFSKISRGTGYYEFVQNDGLELYLASFVYDFNPGFWIERINLETQEIELIAQCDTEGGKFTSLLSDLYKKCIENQGMPVSDWKVLMNEVIENTSMFPIIYPQKSKFTGVVSDKGEEDSETAKGECAFNTW